MNLELEPAGAATPIIRAEDPGTPDAIALIDELSAALAAITGDSGRSSFDADDVRAARACFAVARNANGEAVGCGAFRPLADGVAEVKRMYARPGNPGTGARCWPSSKRRPVRSATAPSGSRRAPSMNAPCASISRTATRRLRTTANTPATPRPFAWPSSWS